MAFLIQRLDCHMSLQPSLQLAIWEKVQNIKLYFPSILILIRITLLSHGFITTFAPPLDVYNPNYDVCANRVYGFWCEHGHLVIFDLFSHSWLGSIPSSVAGLTYLRFIELSTNRITSIDDGICTLPNLQIMQMDTNPLLTHLPDCLGQLPLMVLNCYQCASNNFPATLANNSHVVSVILTGGSIPSFPSDFSSMTSLQYMDVSNNHAKGMIPRVANLPKLAYLDLSSNAFTTELTVDAFAGLTALTYLSIASL